MMRLWEAMLEGAKKGPQLFNQAYNGNGGSCALGAVAIGTGNPHIPYELFPELRSSCTCPEGPCQNFTAAGDSQDRAPKKVGEVVTHLNNDHRWSRQRIAEWLANRELVFAESKTKEAKETTIKQEVVR